MPYPASAARIGGVAGAEDVVTKVSPWSVGDTITQLLAALRARDSRVFTVIDHRAEAAGVGVDLPHSTLVSFGNPKSWGPAIKATPLVAIELPLKVLIWADRDTTMISYSAPGVIADRYQLDATTADLFSAVDAITDAVIAL